VKVALGNRGAMKLALHHGQEHLEFPPNALLPKARVRVITLLLWGFAPRELRSLYRTIRAMAQSLGYGTPAWLR
jgi:hypothetical protein